MVGRRPCKQISRGRWQHSKSMVDGGRPAISLKISKALLAVKTRNLSAEYKLLLQRLQRHFNQKNSLPLPGKLPAQDEVMCARHCMGCCCDAVLFVLIQCVLHIRHACAVYASASSCITWISSRLSALVNSGTDPCPHVCGMHVIT